MFGFDLASGRHARTIDAGLAASAILVTCACLNAKALVAAVTAGTFAVELTGPALIGHANLALGTFPLVAAVAENSGAATAGACATLAAVPVIAALLALAVHAKLFVLAVAIRIASWVLGLAACQGQPELNCDQAETNDVSGVRHELPRRQRLASRVPQAALGRMGSSGRQCGPIRGKCPTTVRHEGVAIRLA